MSVAESRSATDKNIQPTIYPHCYFLKVVGKQELPMVRRRPVRIREPKACQQCAYAKVKCDQQETGGCKRYDIFSVQVH
jgi:hypothetical protein